MAERNLIRMLEIQYGRPGNISSADIWEIFDIRATLAMLSIDLALPRLTDAQVARSERALAEARRQVEQDVPGARAFWLRVDREFHHILTRASGNRLLQRLLAGLQPPRAGGRALDRYTRRAGGAATRNSVGSSGPPTARMRVYGVALPPSVYQHILAQPNLLHLRNGGDSQPEKFVTLVNA